MKLPNGVPIPPMPTITFPKVRKVILMALKLFTMVEARTIVIIIQQVQF